MQPNNPKIAPALQAAQQRRLSLRRSMVALEDALAAPASGRTTQWTPGVAAATAGLQAVMIEHVEATEGPGGFHAEIVTAAPRLAHQAELSVREHVRILALIDSLAGMAEPGSTPETGKVRELGTTLLGLLSTHRQRGADMIFEAYETDLGGGD